MIHDWQIIGHKKQLDLLSKSIASGRLAHAYLFAGPGNVGKFATAKRLAQILTCQNQTACNECAHCKSFLVLANPDAIVMDASDQIKVEAVRDLIYKLSLKPYQSKYKVAIINNAQNLTVEAANALLKSMEEPKSYTIIILVTDNPYRLLPTILSRVQKLNFGLVPESEYASLLPPDLNQQQQQILTKVVNGQPGRIFELIKDKEQMSMLEFEQEQFQKFRSPDLATRLGLATELADLESAELKNTLRFWMSSLERELLAAPSSDSLQRLENVNQTRQWLNANVGAKTLLTQLMIS